MFSKKKIIYSGLVILVFGFLYSQTFFTSGFLNDSEQVFAAIYKGARPNIISVTGISLNKKTLTMKVNEKAKLKAAIKPVNATNKKVYWFSRNKIVVKVNRDGAITAVGKGITTIAAFAGGKFAECLVNVKGASVTGVTLDKAVLTLKVKEAKQLTASIKPADAEDKTLTWTSSNTLVASVDTNGKITAKKVGKATITAKTKDGNKTAKCAVTVK